MIDTAKLNTEELGNIIVDVQNETGFWFDVDDMVAIMQHTVRKADLNGKDEEYVRESMRLGGETYVRHLYAQPLPERLPKRARPDAGDALLLLRRADYSRRRVRHHRR